MNNRYLNPSPFKYFCTTIGELPSSYLESMTYYETLMWLCKYLEETVIPTVNNNANAVTELQKLYNELNTYVKDYFNNLDVQNEINNKLDSMASDGTLAKIIEDYVNIPQIEDNIKKLQDNYTINEITLQKYLYEPTLTNYYIAHIPHTDKNGNIIKLQRGFGENLKATETVRDFANSVNATLCINASVFDDNTSSPNYKDIIGLIINDSQVIHSPNSEYPINQIMGIKEDNSFVGYPYNTDSTTILNDGVINTVNAFQILYQNNIAQQLFEDDKLYSWIEIGQNTNTKDIYIIACDGKGIYNNQGMYKMDLAKILNENYQCDFIYQLDGGGSTSLVYKGDFINFPSNGSERDVPDFIYFAKQPTDEKEKGQAEINAKIGNNTSANQLNANFKKLLPILNKVTDDLNNIDESGIVYVTKECQNSPFEFDSIVHTYYTLLGNSLQIAFPFNLKNDGEEINILQRRRIAKIWQPWTSTKTEWKNITNERINLNYMIQNNIIYLSGHVNNTTGGFFVNIPNVLPKKTSYALIPGSATNYTKCILNVNGNLQFTEGTSGSSAYDFTLAFPLT